MFPRNAAEKLRRQALGPRAQAPGEQHALPAMQAQTAVQALGRWGFCHVKPQRLLWGLGVVTSAVGIPKTGGQCSRTIPSPWPSYDVSVGPGDTPREDPHPGGQEASCFSILGSTDWRGFRQESWESLGLPAGDPHSLQRQCSWLTHLSLTVSF